MGRAFEYRRAAKEKRWDKMSKLFPKLARAITLAAKEGGGDPEMNSKLRTAILNAKAQNLPKDNIERAIKRATDKDAANFEAITYEGKGPHGSMMIVECATDNSTRTVANVKAAFSKNGGQLVPSGSMNFMFERKATIEVKPNEEVDAEELELELIDAGLEEIEQSEDIWILKGDYTSYGTLTTGAEEQGLEITKSSLQYFPTSPIDLSDDQMDEVEKLIDKLEDDDDVQAVYTNIG